MRSRVLITGAAGQLGTALVASAPAQWELVAATRSDCDIGDAQAIDDALDRLSPDLLINAAAYTAVDRAEEEPEAAERANALAPALLAKACARRTTRFFHVSTDFVFDGARSTPYPVDAPTAPLGAYGATKLAGERNVLEAGGDWLILRTGWVYSLHGQNFLRTMLRLHAEREELSVVADQVGTPTSAASLARALWAAAEQPHLTGIYHWSDAGVCSWYDFAQAIGEEAVAQGLLPRAARVQPIATQDYPTAARRPAYSVLDKRKSWDDLAVAPVHWREELRDTLADHKEKSLG